MRKFLMLLTCAFLLSGCADMDSKIVNPTAETKVTDPDFSIKDDVQIDWEQVSTEAEEVFSNQEDYPYSEDFHFMLQPEAKNIMLVWVVSDDLPDSELQRYAENLIKGFNDVVAVQDFSIEPSSDDSYGGLWKTYGLSFGIAPVSTQDDEETWYVSGNYSAGMDFVLPDIEGAIKDAETAAESSGDAS